MIDQVSLQEDAPGILESINKFLEDETPNKIGFDAGITQAYVHRKEIKIHEASFDPGTGLAKVKGHVFYKTGSGAAIPAQCTVDFDIKYNLQTFDLEGAKISKSYPVIGEVKIDLVKIGKVLEGDWAAALELIPNGGLVKRKITSEYDSRKKWFQDKYGAQNIYFATSDFVRWASPVTAGGYILALIGSGGSAASTIAAQVRARVAKELTHIVAWLKTKAAGTADAIAADLIAGNPITLPELKLIWQKVEYRSKVEVGGQSLPETPPIKHAAFVLVWTTPSGPQADYNAGSETTTEDNTPRPKWKLGARYALGATGSQITYLTPGGPAKQAGLLIGEIIVKIDDLATSVDDNTTDIVTKALKASGDQVVELEILSDGDIRTVSVTVAPVL